MQVDVREQPGSEGKGEQREQREQKQTCQGFL